MLYEDVEFVKVQAKDLYLLALGLLEEGSPNGTISSSGEGFLKACADIVKYFNGFMKDVQTEIGEAKAYE